MNDKVLLTVSHICSSPKSFKYRQIGENPAVEGPFAESTTDDPISIIDHHLTTANKVIQRLKLGGKTNGNIL